MKRLHTTIAVTATSVALLAAPGASFARAPSSDAGARAAAGKNIVETAAAAGSFKTLAALLTQAGLASTLQGKGPFTVFAPTDAAFAKVPKKTLTALRNNRSKLRAVLLYHVAGARLPASTVVKRSSIKTLNGKSVGVRVAGRNVFVGGAKVTSADVGASNGVIHVINKVLIPS